MPVIRSHHGDGAFRDLSRRFGPVPAPGYSISFSEFDLGFPHQGQYRFGGLTNIGRECGVYLAIRDPEFRLAWDGSIERDGKGNLKISVLNSKAQSVLNVSGQLRDYVWGGAGDMDRLYQSGSFFSPDINEEYILHFSYEPDSRLAGYKGFILLLSGGTK